MKQIAFASLALVALQACTTEVPASNGPGFQDYAQYQAEQARRDAMLRGEPLPGVSGTPAPAPSVTTQPIGAPLPTSASGLDATRTGGLQASPGNATPGSNPAGLSDEQSFEAVTGRETIESDAQRRAAQAAAYQVVQPTALPTRSGDGGPNIVAYALNTTNMPGQKLYSRTFGSVSKMQRSCAKYPSADAAQRAFLASGGPKRDREGMDPDGDGFACGWDPRPFRLAAGR